jgi:hypothetical protein
VSIAIVPTVGPNHGLRDRFGHLHHAFSLLANEQLKLGSVASNRT